MNNKEIMQKLNNLENFKKIFTGFSGGGKAKKSHRIYSEAETKGVFALHSLRHEEYEGNTYSIYAFSPKQKIDEVILKELVSQLAEIDIGTMKYESIDYTSLESWRGDKNSLSDKNTTITGIAPEYPDVFIFTAYNKIACKYVIYAKNNGVDCIYPLTDEDVKNIIE